VLLLPPGGTSLLTQMRERLELDIAAAAPGGTKVKVTAPVNPTERRHAVWIGESLLAVHCNPSCWASLRYKRMHFCQLVPAVHIVVVEFNDVKLT
jgi:actin-related protein